MKQFDFSEETEIMKFKGKQNSGSDTLIQINISGKEEQSGCSKDYWKSLKDLIIKNGSKSDTKSIRHYISTHYSNLTN